MVMVVELMILFPTMDLVASGLAEGTSYYNANNYEHRLLKCVHKLYIFVNLRRNIMKIISNAN